MPPDGITLPDAARRLLFTHRGLSGPAALHLSAAIARALAPPPFTLILAVLPSIPRDECRALLNAFPPIASPPPSAPST